MDLSLLWLVKMQIIWTLCLAGIYKIFRKLCQIISRFPEGFCYSTSTIWETIHPWNADCSPSIQNKCKMDILYGLDLNVDPSESRAKSHQNFFTISIILYRYKYSHPQVSLYIISTVHGIIVRKVVGFHEDYTRITYIIQRKVKNSTYTSTVSPK